MKRLLTLLFCLSLTGLALAQGAGYGGILGIYFSETQFDQSTMTVQTPMFVPFNAYIVLTDAQYDGVLAYECSITPMHEMFIMLALQGPSDFVNFAELPDIILGFQTPQPVDENGACVLNWIQCMTMTDDQVDLVMGPSSIPSIPGWDGPAIVFEHDIEQIYHLDLSSGAHGYPDVVAVVNPAPVAVESRSLSDVKALFR